MSITVSLSIWTVINFCLLFFVLKHFLFDPVIKFMDKRNKKIHDGLEEGKNAQQTKALKEKEFQSNLDAATEQSAQMIADSANKDNRQYNQIISEAQKKVEDSYAQARQSVNDIKLKTITDVNANRVELVSELVGKIINNKDFASLQNEKIADAVADIIKQ